MCVMSLLLACVGCIVFIRIMDAMSSLMCVLAIYWWVGGTDDVLHILITVGTWSWTSASLKAWDTVCGGSPCLARQARFWFYFRFTNVCNPELSYYTNLDRHSLLPAPDAGRAHFQRTFFILCYVTYWLEITPGHPYVCCAVVRRLHLSLNLRLCWCSLVIMWDELTSVSYLWFTLELQVDIIPASESLFCPIVVVSDRR